MSPEIEQAKAYLLTPWVFHNWLRQKMPWTTAVDNEGYPEEIFQRFFAEKGMEVIVIGSEITVLHTEHFCCWIRLPPWVADFEKELINELLLTRDRLTVFRVLKALYRVERNLDRARAQKRKMLEAFHGKP